MNRLTYVAAFALFACTRPATTATASAPPVVRADPTSREVAAPAPAPSTAPVIGTASPSAAAANLRVPPGFVAPRHFGDPIAPGAMPTPLADVLRTPQRFATQTITVEGTVAAVCQGMGCWMEIRDGATQAHIRMHGHSFFVPRDCSGKHARVIATLVAAHPPTECDDEAREQTGRQAALELDATGVELLD